MTYPVTHFMIWAMYSCADHELGKDVRRRIWLSQADGFRNDKVQYNAC